jgi:O-antigen/teichoic acid export membrane protein
MGHHRTNIARRSITSISWNVGSNIVQVLIGFVRTIFLVRMLPVEIFGTYSLANAIVIISGVLANFGMGGAYLHRAPETEDESHTAAVHFTLKAIFTGIWSSILIICALIFCEGGLRIALITLTAAAAGMHLTQTARLILTRRVVHRRLALLSLLDILLSTLVALGLAWRGETLWALLATNITSVFLNVIMLFLWRPVWRPKFTWSIPHMRYFVRFGSRNVIAMALLQALDRVDDLWTGLVLGQTSLGFYSRAYRFATYPRRVLALPINAVAGGTYAELKDDRKQLSQAFFRTNAFLVRTGFFFAGLMALVAPEFVRIGLGEKWLPMVNAFQLMLFFTLLDPIKATVANLFIAVGRPDRVMNTRFIQLIVLFIGLFLLGRTYGIIGVALAVDIMLTVGIALLLWQARQYADFSTLRMFFVPGVALTVGLALSVWVSTLTGIIGNDLRTASAKIVTLTTIYSAILFILERHQLQKMISSLSKSINFPTKQDNEAV